MRVSVRAFFLLYTFSDRKSHFDYYLLHIHTFSHPAHKEGGRSRKKAVHDSVFQPVKSYVVIICRRVLPYLF